MSIDLPLLIKNIAVIGARGSAGVSDFFRTLKLHTTKFKFNVTLFNSFVQGARAKADIIKNFNLIFKAIESYDVIVLLRGGGSASDLDVFNDYDLAWCICNCPKPVIIGIGHSTDSVILDEVANRSAITPTDLANFINSHTNNVYDNIESLKENIFSKTKEIIGLKHNSVNSKIVSIKLLKSSLHESNLKIERKLRLLLNTRTKLTHLREGIDNHRNSIVSVREILRDKEKNLYKVKNDLAKRPLLFLAVKKENINGKSKNISIQSKVQINKHQSNLRFLKTSVLDRSRNNLGKIISNFNHLSERINDRNPEILINRGYSLTLYNGKTLKNLDENLVDQPITSILKNGQIESKITKINKKNS